jgi:hypothetical protein
MEVDVFFDNGGFHGFSYAHSVLYLLDNGYKINKTYGSSGGCPTALGSILHDDPNVIDEIYHRNIEIAKSKDSYTTIIRKICNEIFVTEDDFLKCNGRLNIITSYRVGFKFVPKIFNHFESNFDIIEAIIASCHIPLVVDFKIGHQVQDKYYYDGYFCGWTPPTEVLHIKFYRSDEFRMKNTFFFPDKDKIEKNKLAAIELTKNELSRINQKITYL